jgi:uncharacterized protein involved in exopolysaccharide biosynthesis
MAAEMKDINNSAEINLRELAAVVWKRKFWIVGFVFLVCAATVFIVLRMDNIYESKAVLRPTQNNTNQMSSVMSNLGGLASLAGVSTVGSVSPYNSMNAIIKDKDFIFNFIQSHEFEPFIIENFQDIKAMPDYNENTKFFIYKSLKGTLTFLEDSKTGLVTVSLQNKNREFTKTFLDKLLIALSARYKLIEMKNLDERIENYKNEINKTSDITLKNKLSDIVSGLIQNKVLAQAQEYYGFEIIVKPSVSDAMDKVGPRRSLICVAMFILSTCVGIAGAVIINGIPNRYS